MTQKRMPPSPRNAKTSPSRSALSMVTAFQNESAFMRPLFSHGTCRDAKFAGQPGSSRSLIFPRATCRDYRRDMLAKDIFRFVHAHALRRTPKLGPLQRARRALLSSITLCTHAAPWESIAALTIEPDGEQTFHTFLRIRLFRVAEYPRWGRL